MHPVQMVASLLGDDQVSVQIIVIHADPSLFCCCFPFLFCILFTFWIYIAPNLWHNPMVVKSLAKFLYISLFIPTHQTLFGCLLPPTCLLKLSLSLHSTQLYLRISDANWTLRDMRTRSGSMSDRALLYGTDQFWCRNNHVKNAIASRMLLSFC